MGLACFLHAYKAGKEIIPVIFDYFYNLIKFPAFLVHKASDKTGDGSLSH